jgi:NitT/TauT family transport system permease protein
MNIGGLRKIAIWAAILLTWEAAYRVIGWRPWIFPAPSHVADATLGMLNVRTYFGDPLHRGWPRTPHDAPADAPADPESRGHVHSSPLVQANLVSATRLLAGFSISILLGGTLGLLMWRFKALDDTFGSLFLGFQTLPSVCWVPLAVILFGLSETGILFVLVMGSFFAIALALRDGLRTIPPVYSAAGQMLGARGWRLYRYILLPASLPAMAGGLRQGFSFAWRSLLGAELIFAVKNRGLGFLLQTGRDFNDVAQVVAVMAVMVALGILADRYAFAKLEARVYRRFGLEG